MTQGCALALTMRCTACEDTRSCSLRMPGMHSLGERVERERQAGFYRYHVGSGGTVYGLGGLVILGRPQVATVVCA